MSDSYENIYLKISPNETEGDLVTFFSCTSSGKILSQNDLGNFSASLKFLETIKETKKKKLSVIFPSEEIVFHKIEVEKKQIKHIDAIAPTLLEDNILGNIEELNFKVIEKNIKEGFVKIITFPKQKFESWANLLKNQNAESFEIIPDILCLQHENNSVNFFIDNQRIICRTGLQEGYGFKKDFLNIFLDLLQQSPRIVALNKNYSLAYINSKPEDHSDLLLEFKKANPSQPDFDPFVKIEAEKLFENLNNKFTSKIVKNLNLFNEYKSSGITANIQKIAGSLPLIIVIFVMVETLIRLFYGVSINYESNQIESNISKKIAPYFSQDYDENLIKNLIEKASRNKEDDQEKFSLIFAHIIEEIPDSKNLNFEQISFNAESGEMLLIFKLKELSSLDKIKAVFEDSEFETQFSVSKDSFNNMFNIRMKINR